MLAPRPYALGAVTRRQLVIDFEPSAQLLDLTAFAFRGTPCPTVATRCKCDFFGSRKRRADVFVGSGGDGRPHPFHERLAHHEDAVESVDPDPHFVAALDGLRLSVILAGEEEIEWLRMAVQRQLKSLLG